MVASPLSQRMGVTERVDSNVNKNLPNQAFKVSIKGHNEYYGYQNSLVIKGHHKMSDAGPLC